MKRFSKIFGCAGIMCLAVSCSNKDDNKDNGCPDCGPKAAVGHALTVDLSGALGVLVTDPSQNAASLMLAEHNKQVKELNLVGAPVFDLNDSSFSLAESSGGGNNEKSLQKVTTAGEIKDVITDSADPYAGSNNGPKRQALPKILTIAVSPQHDIFVHFENSFQYRDTTPETQQDAWDQTKGYQCQLFKVKGGTLETLGAVAPTADNLECVDNIHFINSWSQNRSSVFQFDDAGNVYYSGSIPNGGGKAVVYKVSRDLSTRTEIINSNVCVQDFMVTGQGSVFYTGQTCTSNTGGGGGGGSGYFRYVDPVANTVSEIARDWWNFIFEPLAGIAGQAGNSAMFFGPNPNSASTASWDSACLFKFDPTKTGAESVTNVITCGSDINSWLNMTRAEDIKAVAEGGFGRGYQSGEQNPASEWKAEFTNRCESKGQVFAGGGSQITAIKQTPATEADPDGTGYVIGNLRKKKEGEVTCNVSVKGPHCVINNIPYLGTGYDNSVDCSNNAHAAHLNVAGTWTEGEGRCNIRLANLNYRWESSTEPKPPRTNDDSANPWYREVSGKTKAECMALDLGDETLPENSNPGDWDDSVTTGKATKLGCTHRYNDNNNNDVYDTGDNPAQDRRCAVGVSWTYDRNTDYNNVASPLCNSATTADTAAGIAVGRRVANIWDQSSNVKTTSELLIKYDYDYLTPVTGVTTTADLNNRYSSGTTRNAAAYSTPVEELTKFSTNGMNCNVKGSTGNNWNWTDEYKSLAKVNTDTKSLEMLSSESEQALKMWLVNGIVYYSSYDATAKKYRLQKAVINETSKVVTRTLLIDNMEIYNLSASAVDTKLYFDGLDFSNNTYQFGTVDLEACAVTGCTRATTVGLTGTLKTIVILPKSN